MWTQQSEINTIINNLKDISFSNQNILVTGGAGFLGSWMCDVLISQNANVICIDNLSSGLKANIAHLLSKKNFKFINVDISKLQLSSNNNFNFVFHLASRASPFEFAYYPIEILNANTIGLVNSLEIARKNDATLLYTSTSEIYGNAAIIPTPESYYGNVNSVGPRGRYDEAKRCGEAYVKAYEKQYGLNTRIARIFNTYGPRMRSDGIYGRAIPRFVNQSLNNIPITVFGDGNQTRSFTYLTDQIEGLLKLAFIDKAKGSVINIGNNVETSIVELATEILKITNSKSKMIFQQLPINDPLRRNPVIDRAIEILDWKPKVSLNSGLLQFIEWYKSVNY